MNTLTFDGRGLFNFLAYCTFFDHIRVPLAVRLDYHEWL